MVRPNASSAGRAMRLHVICTSFGELDRDRGISTVVGTEFAVDFLSGRGVDAEVVDVGVVGGVRDGVLDGLANTGCFGSAHDHEVGIVDVTEESVEHVLFVGEGLVAEFVVL